MRDRAASGFHEQMGAKAAKALRAVPQAPRSLAAAHEVGALAAQVVEVVEAFEGSMSAGAHRCVVQTWSCYSVLVRPACRCRNVDARAFC